MSEYRFHLQKYKLGNRYACPQCGRKRCFARYIDEQGQIVFPDNVGRCDHEQSCGYHYSPSDYFKDNPDANCNDDWRYKTPIKECSKEKPLPTFIENKLMEQTQHGYSVNPLYRYISTVFGKEETERLFALYKVGTSKKWGGSTIFWQIDVNGNVHGQTGMHMESIGKIFSHVHQKCILGYKALMLCWSDGRTQFMLDFSLHGEKGKVDGKEQGLTSEQRNGRYERKRDEKSHIAKRKEEYFMSKGVKLLDMVKNAIRNKIPFDYLLVDSWFTCTELVDFVYRRHKKFHLLGMAKMGNTKYMTTNWGELSAKAIITKLKAKKEVKYSRRYHCHYSEIEVVLGKRSVKLFFCKRGKKEAWKVLLTTDLSLRFMRAYEIYSMRWSIEVFFSDSKRLLGLADCSSRDFSAHIAHVSLVMIRYNILASIKRTLDYDTIGGLFGDMYLGVHELTVVEKIWAIIIEVVAVVSELIGADSDELTIQIIENDKRLAALREYAQTA